MEKKKFTKAKPYQNTKPIPNTVEECITEMAKWGMAIDQFKNKIESDAVVSTHHTVGQWIRNEWGLWTQSKLKDYFVQMGLTHPDDMSSVIITSYHRHLNGKPLHIEEQVNNLKNI